MHTSCTSSVWVHTFAQGGTHVRTHRPERMEAAHTCTPLVLSSSKHSHRIIHRWSSGSLEESFAYLCIAHKCDVGGNGGTRRFFMHELRVRRRDGDWHTWECLRDFFEETWCSKVSGAPPLLIWSKQSVWTCVCTLPTLPPKKQESLMNYSF